MAEFQLYDPQTLYRHWEDSQWSPFAVDLETDKHQWGELSREDRDLIHWVLASLMVAEERITTKFSGLVGAYSNEEEATFLATQQVDEARHMQFYARFQDEVVDSPADIAAHVERARGQLSPAFRRIFDQALVEAHERLVASPDDLAAKVRFITIYHLILEATLGLTSFRFVTAYLEQHGLLPGFVEGYTKIHHDETRHIGYGVWFLRETVRGRPEVANPIRDVASRAASRRRRGAEAAATSRGKGLGCPRRQLGRDPRVRARRADPPPRHHRRAPEQSLASRPSRGSSSTARVAARDTSWVSEENAETARRWLDAISHEDFDAAMALVHRDVVLVPPGDQGSYVGAESVRRWMEPEAFPGRRSRYWKPSPARTGRSSPDTM